MGWVGVGALSSLSGIGREVGWGGRLFEAGRLLTFSAFRMGAYLRWALIRGWALIGINTVTIDCCSLSTFTAQTDTLFQQNSKE